MRIKKQILVSLLMIICSAAFAQKPADRLLREFESKYLEIPSDKIYPVTFDATLDSFEADGLTVGEMASVDSRKTSSAIGTRFMITGTAKRHVNIPRKTIEEAYEYAFRNTRILNKAQLVKALDLIDRIDDRVRTTEDFVREMASITGMVSDGFLPGSSMLLDGVVLAVYGRDKNASATGTVLYAIGSTMTILDYTIKGTALLEKYALDKYSVNGATDIPVVMEATEGLRKGMTKAGYVLTAVNAIDMYMKAGERDKARWATIVGKTWLAPVAEFAGYMNEYIRKKSESDAEWTIEVRGQYSAPFEFRGAICYQTWSIDMQLDKMWPENNDRESLNRYNDTVNGTYVGTMNVDGAYNLSGYDNGYIVEKYPEAYPVFGNGDKTRETANLWYEGQRSNALKVENKSKETKCHLSIEKPVVINVDSGRMSPVASGYMIDWGDDQEKMLGPEPDTKLTYLIQLFKLFEAKGGMEGIAYEYFDGEKVKSGMGSVLMPDTGNDVERAMVQAMTMLTDSEEHGMESLGLIAVPRGSITIDVSQDTLF